MGACDECIQSTATVKKCENSPIWGMAVSLKKVSNGELKVQISKKMKISLVALLALGSSLFLGTQAFAQSRAFEGPSIGLNYMFAQGELTCRSAGDPAVSCTGSNGYTGYANLEAHYNFVLSDDVIIGVGGTYPLEGSSSKNSMKDYYTVDVVAGYVLSAKTLMYGKVSYLGDTTYSWVTANRTGNGLGFGLGVRQPVTSNFFIQGEIFHNKFNEVTKGSFIEGGTSNVLSIGGGYQF